MTFDTTASKSAIATVTKWAKNQLNRPRKTAQPSQPDWSMSTVQNDAQQYTTQQDAKESMSFDENHQVIVHSIQALSLDTPAEKPAKHIPSFFDKFFKWRKCSDATNLSELHEDVTDQVPETDSVMGIAGSFLLTPDLQAYLASLAKLLRYPTPHYTFHVAELKQDECASLFIQPPPPSYGDSFMDRFVASGALLDTAAKGNVPVEHLTYIQTLRKLRERECRNLCQVVSLNLMLAKLQLGEQLEPAVQELYKARLVEMEEMSFFNALKPATPKNSSTTTPAVRTLASPTVSPFRVRRSKCRTLLAKHFGMVAQPKTNNNNPQGLIKCRRRPFAQTAVVMTVDDLARSLVVSNVASCLTSSLNSPMASSKTSSPPSPRHHVAVPIMPIAGANSLGVSSSTCMNLDIRNDEDEDDDVPLAVLKDHLGWRVRGVGECRNWRG